MGYRYKPRHNVPGRTDHQHTADIVLPDRIICRCGAVTQRSSIYRSTGGGSYLDLLLGMRNDDYMRSIIWRAQHP